MRWSGFARSLVILSLVALPLGCATVSPLPRFQLEQAGETLTKAVTGRFVLKGTDGAGQTQGTQGRFEWLHYQSPDRARHILILVSPLGQSMGLIEKVSTNNNINVYDHQGLLLGSDHRRDIVIQLLGQDGSTPGFEQGAETLLADVVSFFERLASEPQRRSERGFELGPARFSLTILVDA